jgi:hypothetical protein
MSDAVVAAVLRGAIEPALALLPAAMDTAAARVLLLAIGLQESRLMQRRQLVGNPPRPAGPARGLWQFELGGGCMGVIRHPSSAYWTRLVCAARGADCNARALWEALERDDVLAAACARLLIFTDWPALPAVGDEQGAWMLYLRTWRPGQPHPDTWPALYARALAGLDALAPE